MKLQNNQGMSEAIFFAMMLGFMIILIMERCQINSMSFEKIRCPNCGSIKVIHVMDKIYVCTYGEQKFEKITEVERVGHQQGPQGQREVIGNDCPICGKDNSSSTERYTCKRCGNTNICKEHIFFQDSDDFFACSECMRCSLCGKKIDVPYYKNEDIALILNVHPGTVSNTLNSDLGKVKLAEVRKGRDDDAKKLSEKIRVLRDKALNVYNEIFDDESGESTLKDKKAVADTVALDLAGLRSPTKVQGVHANIQLTPEELEGFKQRGIEAAKEEGIVINVETESETERNKEENRKDG